MLVRYSAERLLYRLSRSAHSERFVLKRALMLLVWLGETNGPTRDADLLGFGAVDAEFLLRTALISAAVTGKIDVRPAAELAQAGRDAPAPTG